MKQHVRSRQENVFGGLSNSFFSVVTGFYLSVHAADYRRIVSIAPYDSDDSFEARKAVLRWCGSQLNSTKVTERWRKAWLLARSAEKPTESILHHPSSRSKP
ncbi:MAG: hypothetical protein AB2693_11615 [Candidatus Thiodiazotropha sp.]